MATELNVELNRIDDAGNEYILHPYTNKNNVIGLDTGVHISVTAPLSSWSDDAQTISDERIVTGNYVYLLGLDNSSLREYSGGPIWADDVTTSGSMNIHTDIEQLNDIHFHIIRFEVPTRCGKVVSVIGGGRQSSDSTNEPTQTLRAPLGYFATASALKSSHPSADVHDWAVVGEDGAIWTWDDDTEDWVKDNQIQAAAFKRLVTLSADGWQNGTQTVTVEGVLEDEDKQFIAVMSSIGSRSVYNAAGIEATKQLEDALVFTANNEPPTEDVKVYVYVKEA